MLAAGTQLWIGVLIAAFAIIAEGADGEIR
jgi:hypothetical protein